jgi:hypothetical protein
MKRLLRLSFLAFALSACSASEPERAVVTRVDPPSSAASGAEPLSAPISAKKTSSLAIVAIPDDLQPSGKLTERQYANGWRQSVSLGATKTAGDWNDLSIDIQTEPPQAGRGAQIPMGKPTEDGIRHEIIARFPTTPMRIVRRPMRNALGPFGLAIGADAGDMRCAFAWQWVDNLPAAANGGGSGGSAFGGGTPASIRMRLCRAGVTADQLANMFERLEIVSAANVDRVIEATKISADAGRDLIVPQQRSDLAEAPVSLESSIVAATRATPVKTAAVNAPRRKAAQRRTPRAVEPPPEYEAPAPIASLGGRQYLAPVAQAARYVAPPADPRGAGFGPARVSVALPPQAYRGPSGASRTASQPQAATAAPAADGQRMYLAPPQ